MGEFVWWITLSTHIIIICYYRVADLSTSTHLFLVHLIGSVYDAVQTLVYDRENVAFHVRRMGHEMPDVSNAFLVEFLQLPEHLRHQRFIMLALQRRTHGGSVNSKLSINHAQTSMRLNDVLESRGGSV